MSDRKEQEEVLEIFKKINRETGWRIGFVYKELKEKWGWVEQISPTQYAQTHTAARKAKEAQDAHQTMLREQARNSISTQSFDFAPTSSNGSAGPSPPQQQTTPAMKRPPSGIPNPMYAKADFSLPQHPYQNFYVAPNINYGQQQAGHMFYNSTTAFS